MIQNTELSSNTKQFLQIISSHLQQKPSGVIYVCTITENQVELSPTVYTYKDIHHRTPDYLDSVLQHVIKYHAKELQVIDGQSGDTICDIQPGYLIPGQYVYQTSINKKRRKWVNYEDSDM